MDLTKEELQILYGALEDKLELLEEGEKTPAVVYAIEKLLALSRKMVAYFSSDEKQKGKKNA